MTLDVQEILSEIGWTTGFHVPVANTENQALEAELERLIVRKAKAKAASEEAANRFDALDKHLKYVKQEAEQNQKLLTAYMQQLDNETHKLRASKAESEHVNQEIRQIDKTIESVQSRQEIKKTDLAKGLTKIEKLKSETAWDTEAVKAWEESLKKRDEDNHLLKKFSKLDQHKANELEARRQNLQMEVVEKRETVAKMVAEIRNYEQMQDRTEKLFIQQEEERKSLVAQWQDAVRNLRQRDDDINRVSKEIAMAHEMIDIKKEELDGQNNFYKNEINNNKKTEDEIEELNIHNSRMRKEYNDLVQYILALTNEVNTLKRSVASCSNHLEKERHEARQLEKEVQNFNMRISRISLEIEELEKNLEEVKNTSMSASERTKQLEKMINLEQQMTKNLLLDGEKMQGILYRHQIALQELKDVSKQFETLISGTEMSNKHLQKQCKLKLSEAQQQKEMVYSLSYRLNEIDVKIAALEGHSKIDEATEIMNAKIAELEAILAEHNDVKIFLQAQVNRLQDEMRRLSSAITADASRIDILRGKLQDQILLFEGGVKQAATAKLKSQQRQVEENVLRLRVSQLEKAIYKEDDNIYDLQKFRIELETSLKERQIEIQTHEEILCAERKNVEEARGRLRADISLRKVRVEQFQKKHHLALMALGKDEDGQPLSITHFKIKNAQEKYQLQQEGDDLDNKIKKAEKEIVAMENTLKIVNMTNVAYKKSLSPLDEESEERLELKHLEQEISNTGIVLREHKKMLVERRKTLQQLQDDLALHQEKWREERGKLQDLQDTLRGLQQEETTRHERITKTCKQIKALKKRITATNLEKPERNIEIRQLQDANKSALQQLSEIAIEYVETTPTIRRYAEEYDLQFPGPKSRATTSSSSVSTLTNRSTTSNSSCSALSQLVLTFDGGVGKK